MATQKGAISKEAQEVLSGVQNNGNTGSETETVQQEENQKNSETSKEKPANGKGPTEQQKVVQPKVINIGKKQPEQKPAKKEVVDKGKGNEEQRLAAEKAEQEFEERFTARLNERFNVPPDRIKEVLEKFPLLEEQLKADPYRSAFTKTLDELIGQGIDEDTAYRYLKADVSKMTPKEIMAFAMQIETGMPMDKVLRQIDRKYKLGAFAPTKKEGENDVPDEQDGLEQLEFDVLPHKKKFDEIRGKTLEQSKSRNSVQQTQNEVARVQKWLPVGENILDTFTDIQVETPNKNILKFVVEMEPAEKQEYLKQIAVMIKNNPNLVADEKGQASVKEAVQTLYIAKNFPKLAIAFAEQARGWNDEEWVQEIHNPSLSNTNGKNDFRQPAKNRDDEIVNLVNHVEGGQARKRK